MSNHQPTEEDVVAAKKYWAFISYSSKDKKYAGWLQSRLENYAIPKDFQGTELFETVLGKHLRPVFRDRADLSGAAKLAPALEKALDESRYLIVLCSKNSARSEWVNKEIERFHKLGKEKHILALILDGEPNATRSAEIDDSEECFPPALRHPTEPLAGDLRKDGDGKERGFLKVLAGLIQVDFDELYRRHERAQRKKRWIIASVAIAVIAALTGLSIFAFYKEREARHERNEAEAARKLEQMARQKEERARIRATARDLASQSHLEYQRNPEALSRAVVLAAESTKLEPSAAATDILRKGATLLARPIRRFPHGGTIYNTLFSKDGLSMATLASDGIRVWDIESGREQLRIPAIVKDVVLTEGAKEVAIAGVNGWGVWDGRTGECIHGENFESEAHHVAISPDTKLVAAATLDHGLLIFDAATGKVRREIPKVGSPAGMDFVGDTLAVAVESRMEFYDPDGNGGPDLVELESRVDEIGISEDGHLLAVACGLEVEIIDVSNRKRITTLTARSAFSGRIHSFAFDPEAEHLAVATDLETQVFRISDGAVIGTIEQPADQVVVDVKRSRLATSSSGFLKNWNLQTGDEVNVNEFLARMTKDVKRGEGETSFRFKAGWVTDFQLGPQSSYVVGVVDQGTLFQWPLDSEPHDRQISTVRDITFDPKKQFVAMVHPSGWVQSTVVPARPNPDVEAEDVEVGFRHHLTFRFGQGLVRLEEGNLVIKESVPRGSDPPPKGNPGSSPSGPGDLPKDAWMPKDRPDHKTTETWAFIGGAWKSSPVDMSQPKEEESEEDTPARYGFLSENDGVWIRDNERGELAFRLGAKGEVASARFLGGDAVIARHYSPAVTVWDIGAKREIARAVHENIVDYIAASQNTDRFATATVDGEVWVWGIPGEESIATLNESEDTYQYLPWILPKVETFEGESIDEKRDKYLRVIKEQQKVLERMICEVRYSADGSELFAYARRGGRWLEHLRNFPAIEARVTAIAAWDTGTWEQSVKPPRWEGAGNRWCDADSLYSSSGERFPYPTPSDAFKATYGKAPVSNRFYSRDGSKLAVLRRSTELRSKEGNTLIQFVDSETGQVDYESEFQGKGSEFVSHIRGGADGNLRYLLIGGNQGGLWDMEKREKIYEASEGTVAPSGAFFTAYDGQGTEVVVIPSLERKMYIQGRLEPEIGPDERWLCLYNLMGRFGKGKVRFIELERFLPPWEIALEHQIETVTFHPGGRFVAVAEGTVRNANDDEEQDCYIRIYDLENRTETIRFAIPTPALSLAFNPVSNQLAAGLRNGLVKVWNWSPQAWSGMATKNLTRNLNKEEWGTFFPEAPYRKTIEGLP